MGNMAEFAQSINFTMQDKLVNIGDLMGPPFIAWKHMGVNNFYRCQKSERNSTNKIDNYCENYFNHRLYHNKLCRCFLLTYDATNDFIIVVN